MIFAGNHISFLDGPVMFGASPRPMHILVKQEMFTGFLGRVLAASGQLPVDRRGGRAALSSARPCSTPAGASGSCPKARRGSGEAPRINNGVAWLALNSGATVVPVAILGTRIGGEHLDTVPAPRRRLHVSFGGAINVSRRPGETGPCFNGQGGNRNPGRAGAPCPGRSPKNRAAPAPRGIPARTS